MENVNYKKLFLKKGRRDSLDRKHPWIFSGAIQNKEDFSDGDLVSVVGPDGNHIGTGYFQDSSIMVRMISFDNQLIDDVFWDSKLAQAFNLRRCLNLPNHTTNCFRLMHGEGDGIPGLIIDVYDDVAVIQAHTIGVFLRVQDISLALDRLFESGDNALDSIYLKSESALPSNFAGNAQDRFLKGEKSCVLVKENEAIFEVDVVQGQKTGFFIDQRENRKLLSNFTKGKSVLNLYAYTGGFSIYSLRSGAKRVVSVDSSKRAIESLDKNLILNQILSNHESILLDVNAYLKAPAESEFDIVIVDPPAFAKSIHKRHNAVQAYKRVNTEAIKRVKSGGLLFTFSCSQVIDQQLFYHTITSAGIESGRECKVLHVLSQSPDHPVSINHPEGKYLKGLVLYIER